MNFKILTLIFVSIVFFTFECSGQRNDCLVPIRANGQIFNLNTSVAVSALEPVAVGTQLGLFCLVGFGTRNQPSTTNCRANGEWSVELAFCVASGAQTIPTVRPTRRQFCEVPYRSNSQIVDDQTRYRYGAGDIVAMGTRLSLRCDRGYREDSQYTMAICNSNGELSVQLANCIRMATLPPTTTQRPQSGVCQVPYRSNASIINGRTSTALSAYQMVSSGTFVQLLCEPGFVTAPGASTSSFCLANGNWLRELPTCVQDSPASACGNVPIIPNAVYENMPNAVVYGTTLKVQCNIGYTMEGRDQIMCLPSGEWSKSGVCRSNFATPDPNQGACGAVPTISNGKYSYIPQPVEYGSSAYVECYAGYRLSGNNVIYCLSTGYWTAPGTCEATTTTTKKPTTQPSVQAGSESIFQLSSQYNIALAVAFAFKFIL